MRPLLCALALLVPLSAFASTFDIYGMGSRGLAMGSAQTADAADFSGAFYNPSQLVLRHKINLSLGLFYENPGVSVTPDKTGATLNAIDPPSSASYVLGLVFPFAGKLRDRVSLGLALSLPTRNLLRVRSADPSEPTWYLYENSPDRIQVFLGLGIRPLKWLSIGGGIQTLADFTGNIEFNVDLFNKRFVRRDLTNVLLTKQAPVAGITLMPLPQLSLAFSYRGAMSLDYSLPTNIGLGDLGTLILNVNGTTFYTPHEFNFGVSYRPIPGLTVDGDLEYARWSVAPNPVVKVHVAFAGDLAKGLGLDQALKLDSQDAPIGFEDILIPRLGVSYHVVKNLAIRGGYFFRPTMIPNQNGLSNLLDGSTHVVSVGLAFWFYSPLQILSDPIQISGVFQHGFIATRHAQKSAANPVPSYRYGGSTQVFAIDVRYNFDIAYRPHHGEGEPAKKPSEAQPDQDME